MADNKSGAFVGGMVLGIAIGAVTGLLTAPKSGKEMRAVLKKTADAVPELVEDLAASLQLQADHLSETALQNWAETLERLRVAIAAGQAASQQEFETLQNSSTQPEESIARRE